MKTSINSGSKPARILIVALAMVIGVVSVSVAQELPAFKQIPGTEYGWHEIAVTLAPGGNYKLVQDKLFSVVNGVYEQYRDRIERQLGGIERQIEIQLKSPTPDAKLQLSDTGADFVVRYPVDIRTASDIDDRVTRAVVDLMDGDAELKSAIVGLPKIRAAIKG
jgi:hypothetical protein